MFSKRTLPRPQRPCSHARTLCSQDEIRSACEGLLEATTFEFVSAFDSAQKQASEAGKPMILYFTGQWCVPCRIMKREVWADDEVATPVNSRFIPVSIDIDMPEHAAILARYNVGGAPVTIITDPQGNVLRWKAGGIGKSEFLTFLDE